MTITQEKADEIIKSVKDDLILKFGDIENINIEKAIEIASYCKQKESLYDQNKHPIRYICWSQMTNAYIQSIISTIISDI